MFDPHRYPGWTPPRQQLHDRLAEQAPPLAGLYMSAVFLLHHPDWPGRHFLLGHAVREIGQRLPDFLDPRKRARAETDAALEAFAAAWSDAGLPIADTEPTAPSTPLTEDEVPTPSTSDPSWEPASPRIPLEVATAGAELVGTYRQGAANNYIKAASIILASSVPDRVASTGAHDASVLHWTTTVRWFTKITHVSAKRAKAPPPEQELVRRFEIIESMIEAILAPFYQVLDQLDGVLAVANAQEVPQPHQGQPADATLEGWPEPTRRNESDDSKGEAP